MLNKAAKLMNAAAPNPTLLCTSSGRVCASGLMAEAAAMKSAAVLISRQRAISSCKYDQGCQPPPKIEAGMWILWAGCQTRPRLSVYT